MQLIHTQLKMISLNRGNKRYRIPFEPDAPEKGEDLDSEQLDLA